jgi:hypothetical protein
MKDHEVVEAFVTFLRDNGYSNLHIYRRPDEENRVHKDIDAIAGQFAIEHTFIPRFIDQEAQQDRFIKAMSGLESELPIPPYELVICSEYDAVKKGRIGQRFARRSRPGAFKKLLCWRMVNIFSPIFRAFLFPLG